MKTYYGVVSLENELVSESEYEWEAILVREYHEGSIVKQYSK